MRLSISSRLLLWLLLPLALLVLAVGGGAYFGIQRNLWRSFDQQLLASAQTIAALTEKEEGGQIIFEPYEDGMKPDWETKLAGARFQAWLPDGSTLIRSASLKHDLPAPAAPSSRPTYFDIALEGEEPSRALAYIFFPVSATPGSPSGPETVEVIVQRDVTSIHAELAGIREFLSAAFTVLIAGGVVIVRMAVRRGLLPLQGVAERVEAVSSENLQIRFPIESVPHEVAPLCGKLNDLLSRLEASFEREKRFTADAAHELRTPVTELRTLAEVELADSAPGGRREGFQEVFEIAVQLEGLIEGLLTLTRSVDLAPQSRREQIDLSAVIRVLWEKAAKRLAGRKVASGMELPVDLTCLVDPWGIRVVLGNLLANSAEYTPDGGRIAIQAEQQEGDHWRVTVTNSTTGLDKTDLEHLCERFWRKDAARSGSEHSGLGLAVAHAVALQCGLNLQFSLDRAGTFTASVEPRIP